MTDEEYMEIAIMEANKGLKKNEVPIGAIIVKDNKIIARAHNLKETKQDVTAHAEILAIRKASKKLNNWRLENAKIYVTLEPCPMCMSAIQQSHIKELYYGASANSMGSCGSKINLNDYNFQTPKLIVHQHILEERCLNLVKNFFKDIRR